MITENGHLICLDDWMIPTLANLNEQVMSGALKAVEEILKYAMEDDDAYLALSRTEKGACGIPRLELTLPIGDEVKGFPIYADDLASVLRLELDVAKDSGDFTVIRLTVNGIKVLIDEIEKGLPNA